MLEISLGLLKPANAIKEAIKAVLKAGYRTKDIAQFGAKQICSTQEMGDKIAQAIC